MFPVPQVIVPEWLFSALVSGLVCTATWHALTFLQQLRDQLMRQSKREEQ